MNAEICKSLYGKTVAVAVSGGADSMALLHFCANFANSHPIKFVALNVEHGIRGESSVKDSAFVKDYCQKTGIPVICYSVNAKEKAEKEKLSLEQAARYLRYECFFNAIKTGKCDAVFTAHHSADNMESVLFNLFRGTGIKGLTGIKNFDNKIFRPLVKVQKSEIDEYVKRNEIPFVTDESNFCDDYSRNFLRLNVIPKVKEVFPEAEKSVARLSETLKAEDEFLDGLAQKSLLFDNGVYYISVDCPRTIMARAVVIALKNLGLVRDYFKIHVDDVCALINKPNGKSVDLPLGIKAFKEYQNLTICKNSANIKTDELKADFALGKTTLGGQTIEILPCNPSAFELKNGLFADLDKIPKGSVIRFRQSCDKFTKFGGGTKSLSDFLTDKKIPKKDRDNLLVVAYRQQILAVSRVAVSDAVKIDDKTKNVIKFI